MTYKLLLLPPKFPLPTLADFLVYLAPPQVILSVCSGHACGMAFTWLLLPVQLGAHWERGVLGSSPSSAADSLGRSLLSSCMMSSVVDDLRAA